ncbi:class I SAM-dependent methyltransferase [Priestia filamentosa]|uniref:class I SAM-dependent methyltransferase n=1 Tax=Priestia filamentosa TaxID=1402861 RepID=UPI001FB2FC80|nr:class I SAM-dependent methyltransferase [Priestia filamentosa]UOE59110.1 class I SAM-dependent methyltransferase [Priestia filamentosa]
MDNKDVVRRQFGENAEQYIKSPTHAKGQDLNEVEQIIKRQDCSYLLDIATGGGHVVNKLAPLFKKVVALDLTEEMLQKAESFLNKNGHRNVSFVCGDAENLPFEDSTFTAVTCRIAPHHFSNVEAFISEVQRVLTPGGVFVLIDNVAPEQEAYDKFYNNIEKFRDPSHVRAYKKSEWVSLIEKNGLKIESATLFPKEFQFYTWCNMMKLAPEKVKELEDEMKNASADIKRYFSIVIEQEKLHSFKGEALLLTATKKTN